MKVEKKKLVQVKTTALCQTKSPKHYRKRYKIQNLLRSPKSQSFSICFVFYGYFYVSLNWVTVLTIEKNTFPDTSYKTSMHIKLSVPCQQVTVYTSDIKKLVGVDTENSTR